MTKGHPKLLSLIIPVFHQEKTIGRNIRNMLAELSQLSIPYEVIVVIDGRVDKSFEEAKKVRSPKVSVVGYKTNHGKGYAVRFGIVKSRGDVIGFIDAGDLKVESLSMMLAHMSWYNADIIVGSKRHPASKVNYPKQRRILSWGYQLLIRLLFGLKVRDTQAGIKLYRRVVLEEVMPRLLVKQFAFDIEILAVAYHLGYSRIYEAPIELDFSSVSSITSSNFWSVIFNMLKDTLAVFYRLKLLRYYDNLNKSNWRYDPELNFTVKVD